MAWQVLPGGSLDPERPLGASRIEKRDFQPAVLKLQSKAGLEEGTGWEWESLHTDDASCCTEEAELRRRAVSPDVPRPYAQPKEALVRLLCSCHMEVHPSFPISRLKLTNITSSVTTADATLAWHAFYPC